MSRSSWRRLVVAYAAVAALFHLSVLLPGNPQTSFWGSVSAAGVQALIIWRLWHASATAWLLAMLFAVGTAVTLLLMQPPMEMSVILVLVLSVAQTAILGTYAAFIWRVARPPEPVRQ
jgi:hypothetical protein